MGNWLKRFGILTALAFPVSVVLYRQGVLGFGGALEIIKVSAGLGALVFLVGVVYWFFTRKSNSQGARAAIIGAVIAIIPVIPLALQAKKASSVPYIHNISTDVVNAPEFNKVLTLRTDQDNPHQYDADALAELQQKAYPEVKTLMTAMSVEEALIKAEKVARELGWEIVDVDASNGLVEATETTLLWGFKDDIVIRVQPSGSETAVDLHSVSRFGQSDLGVNAARIEKFLNSFSK